MEERIELDGEIVEASDRSEAFVPTVRRHRSRSRISKKEANEREYETRGGGGKKNRDKRYNKRVGYKESENGSAILSFDRNIQAYSYGTRARRYGVTLDKPRPCPAPLIMIKHFFSSSFFFFLFFPSLAASFSTKRRFESISRGVDWLPSRLITIIFPRDLLSAHENRRLVVG